MTEHHGAWAATTPPPGWMPPTAFAPPPMGQFPPALPPRPVYREPHPVSAGLLLAGVGATVVWFVLFGSLGRDLMSYAWWTAAAAVSAWLVATFLTLIGDRGVAVGVATTSGLGLSVAVGLVAERWITTNDWPLW